MYEPHPFECISEELKGTSRNPWKAIVSDFSLLSQFILVDVGGRRVTYFWEDKWLGDKTPLLLILVYIIYLPSRTTSLLRSLVRQIRHHPLPWASIICQPIGKCLMSGLSFRPLLSMP